MRHPDTKSLRETMKGHMPQEGEGYLTEQQEQMPMPPVQVVRGGGELLGKSPRQVMEKIYDECRDYAREFGPRSGNLLFTGAPGLGKTFLSACIAREVSDAGFSVVYDTAGHVFSQFEREKFGRDNPYEESADAEVNRCLNCDLLILDDLGSEMTTAFVQSALYQIVNGRLISGRQTIISTNLRPNEIGERYSHAILSRIRGAYQIKAFFGRDLRTPPDRT